MEKQIKIALAGNPNCGKTTLFNALTGSNQFVGNWPGVTVEKKEGHLKKHDDVVIMDLPGIYSLSPYTLEEVVARNYLIDERPDAILNIVDGTNLERNLYLTTQLTELGIPVVMAVNMMDIVRKSGDQININQLSQQLGCKVVEISALKGDGVMAAAEAAIEAAKSTKTVPMHTFSGPVEHAIAHIEEAAVHEMPEEQQRWYAIKIFERDDKVLAKLHIPEDVHAHIEADIKAAEEELDDDAESIITNERYVYIAEVIRACYRKKSKAKSPRPIRSTASSPTAGWACRSSPWSCSSSTGSLWSPSARPRPTGPMTACSATAGTCWASARAPITTPTTNTPPRPKRSTRSWVSTPKPKTLTPTPPSRT